MLSVGENCFELVRECVVATSHVWTNNDPISSPLRSKIVSSTNDNHCFAVCNYFELAHA